MKQESKCHIDFSADGYERRAYHWFKRSMSLQAAATSYYSSHDMDSQDEFNQWQHILCEADLCFANSARQCYFAARARERHGGPSPVTDGSCMESVDDAVAIAGMDCPHVAAVPAIPMRRLLMELDTIERAYRGFFEYESHHGGTPGAMYALGMSAALSYIRDTIVQCAKALASKEGEGEGK